MAMSSLCGHRAAAAAGWSVGAWLCCPSRVQVRRLMRLSAVQTAICRRRVWNDAIIAR